MASTTTTATVHRVDERLPAGRLTALGLQHVLVMYAGAVAVPLIVGRALKLDSTQVALLISADLFACGIATFVQSFGVTRWFGVRLPVMMGVTFAAVSPMLSFAATKSGNDGARAIFGAIIGAGVVAMIIAPLVSRLLRFFPPVVTGSIITVIGVSLMRIGVGWAMNGAATTAQTVDSAALVKAVDAAKASAGGGAVTISSVPMVDSADYAALGNLGVAAFVLVVILALVKFTRGFVQNIAVLLGLVAGCVLASLLGKMNFDKVSGASWFRVVTPFAFGAPTFDFVMILTMSIVMLVVMVESTGMFLALSEMTGAKLDQSRLAAGLRTDGLGTLIGGIFNTFPYTSFSQNVGLVGVTGIRSRFVCVAGGVILMVLGVIPKMASLVESVPQVVLGGAGLVMFGMVAATGVRILSTVDYTKNRHNLYIVAVAVSFGLIPLIAPRWWQHMPTSIQPMLDSGILLAAVVAFGLNLFFNGAKDTDTGAAVDAAKFAEV